MLGDTNKLSVIMYGTLQFDNSDPMTEARISHKAISLDWKCTVANLDIAV